MAEPGVLQLSFEKGDNWIPVLIAATDPGATGPGRQWLDTSGGLGNYALYVRNAANTGWILIMEAGGVFGGLLYKRAVIELEPGDASDAFVFIDFSDSLADGETLSEVVSLEHESHPAGGADIGYDYDEGNYYLYGLYDYSYDLAPGQLWVFTNDDGAQPGPTTLAANDEESIAAGNGVWVHIRNAPVPSTLIVKVRTR